MQLHHGIRGSYFCYGRRRSLFLLTRFDIFIYQRKRTNRNFILILYFTFNSSRLHFNLFLKMSTSSGAGRSQSPDASNLPSTSSAKSDSQTNQNIKKSVENSLLQSKGAIKLNNFDKDWRVYHCKTWHLEPTVR